MRFTVDVDVPVRMRDGVELATNIWRPAGGGSHPALLVRTPYGKDSAELVGSSKLPSVPALVEAGYAVAVQDIRGTARSQGDFIPHAADGEDGVDTVAWLAHQPWCDGDVGAWGGSFMGMAQWQMAAHQPPALRAIAPVMSSGDLYHAPWYSPGGALSLETLLTWAVRACVMKLRRAPDAEVRRDADELMRQLADPGPLLRTTPVVDHPLLHQHFPWLSAVLDHPSRDGHWEDLAAIERAGAITVPALNVGGWYDVFLEETIRCYTAMRRNGGSVEARAGQRLVIGPWGHPDGADLGRFPDRSFGPAGSVKSLDVTDLHLRFFDRYVRGRSDALEGVKPVRIFVMGIDRWREEDDWPLPGTRYVEYHLASGGRANTAAGDGTLAGAVAHEDAHDVYLYDPRRPVPTIGGATLATLPGAFAGPADQSPVETRDDVLCFTTPVLTRPVEVTGPVTLILHVSSSAVDTDFTGKLVDVHPDGRAIILCEGAQRARYRSSLSDPALLRRDEVYELTFGLSATSNVFLPGHRIRLEVSSSNFPRYDRNSNTGGSHAHVSESDTVVAVNRVHHGPSHPSRLVLPVIDR